METKHPFMPGYRLNEYLVVISLNEDLRNKISAVRKNFQEKYGVQGYSGGKSHIALVRFVTWNMMEEKLLTRFQHIAMGITPFKIELKGFGSYPTHSIYINVATKIPIENLLKQLRTAQRMMKAHPEHDPHFITDSHIPVARKLLPWQYEKGWLEYSQLNFNARIIADSMLVLKRPLGEQPYQIIRRFDFMNLPVTTTQGELFA